MLKFNIFIFSFIISHNFVTSNLWDNLFSQLKSPQLVLPEESKVELFNKENKMMEVISSTSNNVIKISLLDKHFIQTFANFTNAKDFLNIYLNFTNGTVKFDWEDQCSYLNVSMISKFKLKFFLASYDLLTFFNDAEQYYEYYFTNPLHSIKTKNDQLKFLQNDDSTKFSPLNTQHSENNLNEKINFFNKLFSIDDFMENEAKIVFKVDKKKKNLEKVILNYKNLVNLELTAKSYSYDEIDGKDFKIRNNCTLFKLNNE